MSVRKVLAPLLGGPNDGATLSAAIAVSEGLEAHLEVCFVRPDPEKAGPYLGIGGDHHEEIKEEYRQHVETTGKKAANRARRQFNAACKKHGIAKAKRPSDLDGTSAHWVEVVGRATREVPEAAKLCDISVFAGPLADYHRLLPNVLECTLLESGRPLLFVPDGSIVFPLERIAIAWDASVQAVHAVDAAGAFLQDAKDIQVLSVEEFYEDTADPQRLVEILAWHGLDAEGRVVPRTHEAVGHALLSAAQDIEASLLVMGGYAHNRFEEAVFGGTTLHAMRHTHLPLLMMH